MIFVQTRIFQNIDKNYSIIPSIIENLYHVQSVCLKLLYYFVNLRIYETKESDNLTAVEDNCMFAQFYKKKKEKSCFLDRENSTSSRFSYRSNPSRTGPSTPKLHPLPIVRPKRKQRPFLNPSAPSPPLNPIQTFPNFPYEFKWKLLPRPGRFTQFPVALLEAELPLRRRRRCCRRPSPPPPTPSADLTLSTCALHRQPVPWRVSLCCSNPLGGMMRPWRAPAGPGSGVCMHTGAG